MKIIGASREGLILQASRDEVANLMGHYYAGQIAGKLLEVGAEVKVSAMYQQMYALSYAQRDLKAASDLLHKVADEVLAFDPLIQAVLDGKTTDQGVGA